MADDREKTCPKSSQIDVMENEQKHIKDALDRIESYVQKIDHDVNNGINDTMKAIADQVTKHGIEINGANTAIANHSHRDPEHKDRKSDKQNMSVWKKAGIVVTGITAFIAVSYSLGSFFIWLGKFLQNLPK